MNDDTRQTIDHLSDLATGRAAGDFLTAYREAVRSADVVTALRDTGQLPSYNAEAVYTSMREKGMEAAVSARQGQDHAATVQQTSMPSVQNDNMATSIQRVVDALKSSASIGATEERPATPLAARLQSWRDAETAQAPAPAPAQSPAPSPALETVGPSQSRSSSPSPG